MAGQKLVGAFLMCLVLAAALRSTVADTETEVLTVDIYKKCLKACEDKCHKKHKGYTFCEMKCDSDCGAQEFRATLAKLVRV